MSRILVFSFVLGACAAEPMPPADLVLLNGRLTTLDPARPAAQAMAISGDRIVAVGGNRLIRRYVGDSTEVIDLEGRRAAPGFIESHGHFMSLGRARMILDLTQVDNWNEIVAMVAQVTGDAAQDAWITGRGWHQEKWDQLPADTVEGVPTHTSLSAVSPRNPVYLTHASGHASFANARAMALAGIDRRTPDPEGGEIVRDAAGRPTGLMRENAQDLFEAVMARANAARRPEEIDAERRRRVELAGEDLHRKGVTSFHDAGSSFATIRFLRDLAEEGNLPVRLYMMVRHESNDAMARELPALRVVGAGNNFFTVRAIKRQIDGALGSHGAWLLEPYVDLPTSTGLVLEPVADIERTAAIALEHGYQVNTHAIGDRANREVLDIYARTFDGVEDPAALRWRIEHAQHVHPDDIPRFAQLGIIAAVQGVHATSDGPWIPQRLGGERTEVTSYRWRDFIEAGVMLANGTDAPVEDVDPIASFHASVARVMRTGEPFYPAQAMTREEALRSYTINGAYAAFEEDLKGSLEVGKLADVVVLSRDIMTVPDEEIPGTEVVYTIVGGRVRYAAER